MASLTTASRLCLRSAAKPVAPAVRALSTTTTVRSDAASSSSYKSPFITGSSKGSSIPEFGKYFNKDGEGKKKLFSYFMVGSMGAITAAGAKSTVQGAFVLLAQLMFVWGARLIFKTQLGVSGMRLGKINANKGAMQNSW